jgi:hypothetical protein
MSGNAMLSSAQEAGVGIRRADFLSLVGEVRAATANASAIQALAVDEVAQEAQVTQWEGGATNTYLHRITMYVREGEPSMQTVVQRNFDVLSDHILSAAEATESAESIFNGGKEDDNYADQELLGSELRNIFHQQGSA